jgi:hypothetical protein
MDGFLRRTILDPEI